jgi:FimV-like protein
MKYPSLARVPVLLASAVSFLALTTASPALWPFSGKKERVVPVDSEREAQEVNAAGLYSQAEEAEREGKTSRAQSIYKEIVKKYPFTKTASEASFRNAMIVRHIGKMDDAFDALQHFVQTYRDSPHFNDAIEQEFEVAEEAKGGRKQRGFLMMKMKMNSSDVIKFYEKIIKNAPYGKYAALSQFSIAEVWQDLKDKDKAVIAYQKVVENYPNTSQAAEAQFRIGSISNIAAQRSEDASNLLAARDAVRTYMSTHPAGERTQESELILSQVNTAEANQSLTVAKFYRRIGKTKAAAIYLNEALKFGSPEVSAEARTMLAELASADPTGVASVKKGPGQDYTVLTAENLKSRDDYVGPMAPDVGRLGQKPKMRTGDEGFMPIPLQEPNLPEKPGASAPGPGSLLPPVPETEKPALLPVPGMPQKVLPGSSTPQLPVPPPPASAKPAS